MNSLTPTANHILVGIPSRYHAPSGPRNPTNGLGITLISGDDAMAELEAQIKRGGQVQIETETDTSIRNLVRTGQVLAVCERLTDEMVLCSSGRTRNAPNSRRRGGDGNYYEDMNYPSVEIDIPRTYADITPVVEVGDTVYLDWTCLTDENELLPGIYRVPYGAVICKIWRFETDMGLGLDPEVTEALIPVGGYVLLSRVWADDCTDYEVDGRMRKVRFHEDGYLIKQLDVPPLPNEGVVKWVDAPLKGALNELHPGERVVLAEGHALVETIAGEEYLCIRHDYVLAKRAFYPQDVFDSAEQYEASVNSVVARIKRGEVQRRYPQEDIPLHLDCYNA